MDSKLSDIVEQSQLKTDEDEEFTFAINGGDSSPISADDAFEHGQIRPVYPLFNRDLLLSRDDLSLPVRPPVDKVFIESPARKSDEIDRLAAGPYCAWAKTPEMSKKSNSTGFSKLWRFKEYMQRRNSDGRDAYVFFNHSETKNSGSSEKKIVAGESSSEKKAVAGEKKKVKKGDKTMSSHEVYLKKKGYNPEEERRKSYLPYRPELVGFFTNVNGGGLSKNVHPY